MLDKTAFAICRTFCIKAARERVCVCLCVCLECAHDRRGLQCLLLQAGAKWCVCLCAADLLARQTCREVQRRCVACGVHSPLLMLVLLHVI